MKTALSVLWASVTRTFVPIIVGAVLGWAVALNIPIDPEFEAALGAVLFAAFSGAWYLVSRLLELYVSPRFGWLLGLAKAPTDYEAQHAAK